MRRTPDQALQHLREAHGGALSTYCLQLTGSPEAAAGALDETFAAARERLGAGRTPRDPRTALFAGARDACLRRVAETGATGSDGPVHEGQDDVLAASERLPLRFRESLVLRELERMPLKQIAAITGRSPHESAHLAWRARAALQAARPGGMPAAAVAPTPDCESVLTLSELRADGPLAPAEERWRSAHLRRCRRCEAGRAAIAGVGEQYRRAGGPVPAPAAAAAATAVAAPVRVAARRPRRAGAAVPAFVAAASSRRRLTGVVLAAALALALALAAGLLAPAGDDGSRSVADEPVSRDDARSPRPIESASPEIADSQEDRRPAPTTSADAADGARRSDEDRPRSRRRAERRTTTRERSRSDRSRDRTRSRRQASDGGGSTPPAPARAPSGAPPPTADPSPAPAPSSASASPAPAPAAEPASQPPPARDDGPPCKPDKPDKEDKPDKGKGGKDGERAEC